MNSVLLILPSNLHWAPYYTRYEKILKDMGISFDLILWNREGIKEDTLGRKIEYKAPDETNNGSAKKIFKFIGFARFILKEIKNNNYNKIVFVGTYAGTPALLSRYLERNYKGRYWIDLRDITYERFRPFFCLESRAIINSYKTVISSKGYCPYLPRFDYGFIHNIDPSIEEIARIFHKSKSDIIRVSYIGNLAYWNACKEMIDVLANDNRFVMNFIGPNYEVIQQYCEKNSISNVSFHGRFKREDTVRFYMDTDIIYNIYGNDTVNVRTALSNKLYYAMRFRLPILVSQNTYMEKIVKKYNIGISFENSQKFADKLYNWYLKFDSQQHFFDEAWKKVSNEDRKAVADFIKFIGG